MISLISNLPTHLKVTITAWISRAIIAITNLIAIKILLPYLGVDSFAIYVVLLSFASWCALSDFGIGFSLQNYISEFRVKKQDYQPYINSAFQIIIGFTIVAIILATLLCHPIQTFILRKYLSILSVQNINIVLVTLILLIMVGITNISTKIYYALQKGTIPNILTSIAYIISFCTMLVIVNTQSENNKLLKIVMCFTLPQILLLGYLFIKIFKNSIRNILKINKDILNNLFNRATKFGGMTIMLLMLYEIDYFIMAKTVNSTDIAVYSVFTKIFLAGLAINGCLLTAFWPLCTELYNNSNYNEIKTKLKKYLIFGISLLTLTIILSFIFKDLIFKFLLPTIDYNLSYSFFLLCIIYFGVRIICDTYATFLQSISYIKAFLIYVPIQAFISIILQYVLSLKYGINGIILGLLISYMLVGSWFVPYKSYKILKYDK